MYGSVATSRAAAVLVAIMLVVPFAGAKSGPAAEPNLAQATAFVKEMYRAHFAHNQRWDLTFKRYRTRLTSSLLAAFAEEDRWSDAHPDEVPNLDGDPLTSAQDVATGYVVGVATRDGDGAVVPVKVRLDAETRMVRVRLVLERGTWRIADIDYDEGPSLVGILKLPHV